MNDLHLVLASEECEHFRCGVEWMVVSDGRWDHNPGGGEVQLALALDHLDCECTFTMSVLRAAQLLSWNEAKRLSAAESRPTQKALLREAVLPAEDNTLPPKKHWPPVGGIFEPFLLCRWQEASMQRRTFAALCLTPGLAVWTFMIMSSVSCVEWHLMGKRETSLRKPGPALFVCCDTSNIMVVRMGTMISNSVGMLVGQG